MLLLQQFCCPWCDKSYCCCIDWDLVMKLFLLDWNQQVVVERSSPLSDFSRRAKLFKHSFGLFLFFFLTKKDWRRLCPWFWHVKLLLLIYFCWKQHNDLLSYVMLLCSALVSCLARLLNCTERRVEVVLKRASEREREQSRERERERSVWFSRRCISSSCR